MSWFYRPYVSVAQRRSMAEKKIKALQKKGRTIEPVTAATPRGSIATSFWGEAWCDHLESYSDFSNRLPRGRSYLRNGSVLHLGIEPGRISALVMGSEMYEQTVNIKPLPAAKWKAIKQRCQGRIGSLVELLQGKISGEIMAIVTDRADGLFPSPKEIDLDCSCPDWADLCKHLAAVLYGVGARLDDAPELLFKLRGVDHNELIQADPAIPGTAGSKSRRRTIAPASLGDVFGIDLDADPAAEEPPAPAPQRRPAKNKRITRVPTAKTKPTAVRATKKKATVKKKAAAKKKAVAKKKTTAKVGRATAKKRTSATTRRTTKPRGAPAAAAATTTRRVRKPAAARSDQRPTSAPKPFKAFKPTPAAVERLRKQLGLSRNAFAARLGVSAGSIVNWETRGRTLKLHDRSLNKLRELHVSVNGAG